MYELIGWIWNPRTPCTNPACRSMKFATSGRWGRIRYRRCIACATVFKVVATHAWAEGPQGPIIVKAEQVTTVVPSPIAGDQRDA